MPLAKFQEKKGYSAIRNTQIWWLLDNLVVVGIVQAKLRRISHMLILNKGT